MSRAGQSPLSQASYFGQECPRPPARLSLSGARTERSFVKIRGLRIAADRDEREQVCSIRATSRRRDGR